MARKKETDDSLLTSAAKAIGTAAGKVASLVGVTADAPKAAKEKKGKLPKLNKPRVPRRQKKLEKKAVAKGVASKSK